MSYLSPRQKKKQTNKRVGVGNRPGLQYSLPVSPVSSATTFDFHIEWNCSTNGNMDLVQFCCRVAFHMNAVHETAHGHTLFELIKCD